MLMTTRMKIFYLLLIILLSQGCSRYKDSFVSNDKYQAMLQELLTHDVNEISVRDIKTDKSIYFIDTRSLDEYNVSHIKGAIWCGYSNFNTKCLKNISKKSNIIVYCSVGYRSEKITEKLQKYGYTNTLNLYGGIFEWVNENHEIVDNSNLATTKIHAFNQDWGKWLSRGNKVY